MKNRDYVVGPDDEADVRAEFFISETFEGLEALRAVKPNCAELVKMTLDMQLPDDSWVELWNEYETSWYDEET